MNYSRPAYTNVSYGHTDELHVAKLLAVKRSVVTVSKWPLWIAIHSGQILIATHNPLMISAHPRTHVRILSSENGTTTAHTPEDEPPGMSIDRLLTSEVFGLDSALPPNTLHTISERERLAALPERSEEEDKKLRQLSEELELAGLLRTYRLPEEKEFIDAMRRREKRSIIGLTDQEIEARNERADALLEEIF